MKRLSKASMATMALAASVAMTASFGAHSGTAKAGPVDGGTITFGQAFSFQNEFIPLMVSDAYTFQCWAMSFDTLMNTDAHINYIPWLAKSWSFSKDRKTLTMHLDPKANWSDGKPITSDDVLLWMDFLASKDYNTTLQGEYESLVDPVLGSADIVDGKKTSFTQTGGFKKINDKTFQITFSQVDAAVLYSDVAGYIPLPAHVLKSIPFKDWPTSAYDKKPSVVSGAYLFKQVNGTDSVEYDANPRYFKGKPHIDHAVIKTVSADVAPGLLANGSVDFQLSGLKPQDVPKLKQIPSINVTTLPSLTWYYLGEKMNTYPEFKDYRVREAFEYAMDRKAMVNGIYKGYGTVLNGPLPAVSWAAAGQKDGLNPYNYDTQKAGQLLDAAGWTKGPDGWRIDPRTGKKADLHLLFPIDPIREAISVAIQQELRKVGINVTLDTPLDLQSFYKKVQNDDKSVMMYVAAWQLGTEPDPRGLWGSKDPSNYPRWVDTKDDSLMADTYGAKAFDKSYRKKAFIKWQVYVNQQLPLNFLFQRDDVYAINKRVNIPKEDWGVLGPFNYYQWWLSK